MSICLRLCFALFVACVVVAFVAFALFVALFVFRIVVSHCLSHDCVCSHCLWHRLRFAFACVCVSRCCVALFVVLFVQCWCFMHVHRVCLFVVGASSVVGRICFKQGHFAFCNSLSTLVTSMVWESVFCVATSEKSIKWTHQHSEQVAYNIRQDQYSARLWGKKWALVS